MIRYMAAVLHWSILSASIALALAACSAERELVPNTMEKDFVQTGMDAMMADREVTSVTPNTHSTSSWSSPMIGSRKEPCGVSNSATRAGPCPNRGRWLQSSRIETHISSPFSSDSPQGRSMHTVTWGQPVHPKYPDAILLTPTLRLGTARFSSKTLAGDG